MGGENERLGICQRCQHTFCRDVRSLLCLDCRPQPSYAICDTFGYMTRAKEIRIREGWKILRGDGNAR
jgi:hypothetical protein